MKRVLAILVLLTVAVPLFAEKDKTKDKNKDWQSARLIDVKTQDMQSGSYSNPNAVTGVQGRPGSPAAGAASSGPTGGSFSSAPAHFIIYNILIETEQEAIWATLSREASFRPPELKIGTDVEYKSSGPKFIELKDAAGKKYEFKVTKREKKEPAIKQ